MSEQWVGTTTRPVERVKRHAKIHNRDGRKRITYPDEINGVKVTVEMPQNAPPSPATKAATTRARIELGRWLSPVGSGIIVELLLGERRSSDPGASCWPSHSTLEILIHTENH
jgi:hypothetical protein